MSRQTETRELRRNIIIGSNYFVLGRNDEITTDSENNSDLINIFF